MKKLMIAAAVVCAAAFAQAAQYSWGASDICTGFGAGGANDNNASGTAYLFLNGGDTSLALVQASVEAGTFADNFAAKALDTAAFADAVLPFASSAEGLAGATGDSFFAVFVANAWTEYGGSGAGTVDPAQAFVTSAYTPGAVETLGKTTLDFGSLYEGTYGDTTLASGWSAQSVPEPTSGLLMLIGIAGLALRRKRA